ncbi:MAG: topoisomerase IV [Ruminococcaceae bacterium]|nr:topoisomerase IV [Oscillospiraceae bacterium]
MAKKKKASVIEELPPAPIRYQPITETLETNYMPYVMTVIVSRAIPEIDGFKPSHRKLLYTMYKMGLMNGPRVKSATIAGRTMAIHPHGDAGIYETMVRLTRDYEALLHPFVDSKGAFGKQYSSNMKASAPRYTEARLESFCNEIFKGIDKDAVEMVDNYDGTMQEPVLLPTTFPNVLVTPNMGIAVGMASNICPFNLAEVCDGTIAMLKKPGISTERLMELIKGPDFPGGGLLIYDRTQMKQVFETGVGPVRLRARYRYDKEANCIDILQIPYSTTIEQIIDKIADLVKSGSLKEVTDFRDEIDLSGFKLTLDLRKGVDPDKLMTKLFKVTPLEDSFKCNFNILIDSAPRQMGIAEILREWIFFRMGCVRRELTFDLSKKRDKLHLLEALAKVLLDIDLAIRIIRKTEKEEEVIPSLMTGFDIDEVQANYIAEIKLRHLNREYILNRIAEMENLRREIAELEDILGDELKIKAYIAAQLTEIKKKYGKPRITQIMDAGEIKVYNEDESVENYPVKLLFTSEGYFKKIAVTPRTQFSIDDQKMKDGDSIIKVLDAENKDELVFFTDKCQVYRSSVNDFDALKSSAMGDYLPTKLKMDEGERPVYMELRNSYPEGENYIFLFENGKGVRVPVTAYVTKGNRRKLTGAYSDASPLVAIFKDTDKHPTDILLISSADRAILIKSSLIPLKTTRTSGGVQLMNVNVKKGHTLAKAVTDFEGRYQNVKSYRKLKIPASGTLLEEKNIEIQQIKIDT